MCVAFSLMLELRLLMSYTFAKPVEGSDSDVQISASGKTPVLPSTPKDAHWKVSTVAEGFSQSCDTRAELCPALCEPLFIS